MLERSLMKSDVVATASESYPIYDIRMIGWVSVTLLVSTKY